jgi:hypothetical protein
MLDRWEMLVLISCVFHGKGLEGDFLDDQTVEKILRQAAYGIGEGAPVPVGGLFRVRFMLDDASAPSAPW